MLWVNVLQSFHVLPEWILTGPCERVWMFECFFMQWVTNILKFIWQKRWRNIRETFGALRWVTTVLRFTVEVHLWIKNSSGITPARLASNTVNLAQRAKITKLCTEIRQHACNGQGGDNCDSSVWINVNHSGCSGFKLYFMSKCKLSFSLKIQVYHPWTWSARRAQ